MTIRFKKARDFERIKMLREIEQELYKEDLKEPYTNQRRNNNQEDLLDYGFIESDMTA